MPHGYAVATVALPGTDFSTGCSDVGADLEVLGSKAVVDWVNGRAMGRFLDGTRARAKWATGKVGMIGVSWDGTIANSVAATGVEGLETIVPVAAISSWYDYTRGNGITYYDDHIAFLHEYVSNFDEAFCETLTPILQEESDDATSSYNTWWSERDYRLDAENITASVFVVHGLSDENVKTGQFGYWWDELVENDVERKLFLHQNVHIDPVSFGATYTTPLLEWFDYYLQDLDNGVPDGPQAIIQRESGAWSEEEVWPPEDTDRRDDEAVPAAGRSVGGLSTDGADGAQAKTAKIVQSEPYSDDAIVATRPPARRPCGVPVEGTGRRDPPGWHGAGQAAGQGQQAAGWVPGAGGRLHLTGSAYIVSRTMASLNHHAGLDEYETLEPGKYYTLKWNIHTDDRIFADGHRLGLVITAEKQNIEGGVPASHRDDQAQEVVAEDAADRRGHRAGRPRRGAVDRRHLGRERSGRRRRSTSSSASSSRGHSVVRSLNAPRAHRLRPVGPRRSPATRASPRRAAGVL